MCVYLRFYRKASAHILAVYQPDLVILANEMFHNVICLSVQYCLFYAKIPTYLRQPLSLNCISQAINKNKKIFLLKKEKDFLISIS